MKAISLSTIAILLCTILLAVPLCAMPAQAADTDWWPMFHHDLTHTGYSTSTAPTTNHLIWTFQYDASANILSDQSSPAVADGMVFIGSMNDYVYALSASSGTPIWSYKTGNGIESSPAVDSAREMVFIGSDDGYVYALNEFKVSGSQLIWSYNTGGGVWASPTVADGMVFVGSMDGYFFALNEATGTVIWHYYTSMGWFESSPAVAGGMVFVGSCDNTFYALDATTGALVWSYATGGPVVSSPAIASGIVYVGSADGYLYAFSSAPPVGGIAAPVDNLAMLTPYVGLISTLAAAAVATAVCVKRVKRGKEKQ